MPTDHFEVAIIGGGMAGVSAAAFIAPHRRTLLIERESALAMHTTGRSAAVFYGSYGAAPIRALSRASLPFFLHPPEGFAQAPLLKPRSALMLVPPGGQAAMAEYLADADRAADARVISPDEAVARVPVLRRECIGAAVMEDNAWDMDVDLILQGFRRMARAAGAAGAQFVMHAGLTHLAHHNDGWQLTTTAGKFSANVVVNAAGAWADEVAAMAGLAPLGLQPKRRTAFTVPAPPGHSIGHWPLVSTVHENFYFKSDAGVLLMSLADETDSPPMDAWPHDEDVALAVQRVQAVAHIAVPRILSQWAGLRSFFPDRVLTIGPDPRAQNFIWLAGQGGYGIQTAPAAARLAAAHVTGQAMPDDLLVAGVQPEAMLVQRLL
jgi:D-arginine dehydrogenase